jgi:hypothetical protein
MADVILDLAIGGTNNTKQKQQNKELQVVKKLLSKMPFQSVFIMEMAPQKLVGGTINEEFLDAPVSSYYAKHGESGIAEVFVIGVKESNSLSFSIPDTTMVGSGQRLATVIKNFIFPPDVIQLTPVAIFRKIY